MTLKQISRRLLAYLFRGILISGPLAVTAYILFSVFQMVDHIIPHGVGGVEIPGLGILILLLIFVTLGWIGGTFLAQPIITYFNRLLDQIPLVKTLYNSIKDFLSAFVGQKKSFSVPVLIKVNPHSCIEQLGFLTTDDLCPMGLPSDKVAVYVPLSYSVAGNVYIVNKSDITYLQVSAHEVMKFIVSGGVSGVESKPGDEQPEL